jgi:catechol O-methyltransferase
MDFLDDDSGSDEEADQLVSMHDNTSRETALQARPPASGVLSFHTGVEDMLLLFVARAATDGDPDSVLLAVDNFCYTRHWMMHVGDIKGDIIEQEVHRSQEINASVDNEIGCFVEVGSYCGYSAVRIAKNLRESELLCSIEIDERCRKWTRRLLEKAGLSDKVVIVSSVQAALSVIRTLETTITFIFIDHAKEQYVSDLKLFEQSGLMQSPGCVVVADNILSFNISLDDYINHVSNSGLYSDYVLHKSTVEYSSDTASAHDTELIAASSDTTTTASCNSGNKLEDGIATCIYR